VHRSSSPLTLRQEVGVHEDASIYIQNLRNHKQVPRASQVSCRTSVRPGELGYAACTSDYVPHETNAQLEPGTLAAMGVAVDGEAASFFGLYVDILSLHLF